MNPYIGINDFTDVCQVKEMSRVFSEHLPQGSERKLYVGAMMSRGSLLGAPGRMEKRFPPKERIAEIFSLDETYNCLHYAEYEYDPDFCKNFSEAIAYGGIGIHAVQLDAYWPDPGYVAECVHRSRKSIDVILQISSPAFDEAGKKPLKLLERLEDYEGVINGVLLDRTMARGLGLETYNLVPFVRAIRQRYPSLHVGVAGGIGPKSMHLVKPFISEYRDVSIVAHEQLRPSGNVLDPIDWDMAKEYLVKALHLFS
jgi:hypothetical protein